MIKSRPSPLVPNAPLMRLMSCLAGFVHRGPLLAKYWRVFGDHSRSACMRSNFVVQLGGMVQFAASILGFVILRVSHWENRQMVGLRRPEQWTSLLPLVHCEGRREATALSTLNRCVIGVCVRLTCNLSGVVAQPSSTFVRANYYVSLGPKGHTGDPFGSRARR